MSKITAAAQGKNCTCRLPGVCNHDPSTSVWCHIRGIRWGAGKGIKPPDLLGYIGCSACHDVEEGRVKTNLEKDFIKMCVYEAHMESLYILTKEGII